MDSKPIHLALNSLDHLPPPNYANAILYLRLKANVNPEEAFDVLRKGLHRTFVQLPWLSGKVHPTSTSTTGALEIRYYPITHDRSQPYQLKFNELDSSVTYEELRESSFHPSTFEDEELTWVPFLPNLSNGTEVFVAQANFLPGACILTAAICHAASDGMGVNSVLKIWADNCQDVQLGNALKTEELPEISDHNVLEQIWSKEGAGKSAEQIPPETWRLLGLEAPGDPNSRAPINGLQEAEHAPAPEAASSRGEMKAYIFYISPANVKALRDECIKDPGATDVSVNDVICALVWRSLLKSRTAAKMALDGKATNIGRTTGDDDAIVRLDLPFDVRPYFPEVVPPNYLGNFTMINQVLVPLSYLVAPSTNFGPIARMLRQVAGKVTTATLMDAYTLVKTLVGRDRGLKLQNLKVDGNGLMITSLLAFELAEVCFGERVFGNGGKPEAMRTLMGAINKAFRYCAILPRKSHGGVEFVANLFDDEMDLLMEDGEFSRYAMLVA
ncbi:hypothetical protein F5X99DRAFT_380218 [Biscogniauxia marginata]|nr:hypothetical protein F5X99DRAFT_380218 [Biscogniauxia marginata]